MNFTVRPRWMNPHRKRGTGIWASWNAELSAGSMKGELGKFSSKNAFKEAQDLLTIYYKAYTDVPFWINFGKIMIDLKNDMKRFSCYSVSF